MNTRDAYADMVSRLPRPAAADMPDLWARAARGDKAATDLIAHQYLPFVISRVRHALATRGGSPDFMDLVQEGNLGLLHAIQRFDESRGAHITTYACYWIDAKIRRFSREHNHTIRVRGAGWDNLSRLRQAETDLRQTGDAKPAFFEIARQSGLTPRKLTTAIAAQRAIQETVRLDQPVFDGEETTVMETIPDPATANAPAEAAEHRDDVRRALAAIPGREAGILRMRFGFCSDEPMTLDQVGRVMGISRERVRQLESRGLERFRAALDRVRRGYPAAAPKGSIYARRINLLRRNGLTADRIRNALRKAGALLKISEIQSVLAVPA